MLPGWNMSSTEDCDKSEEGIKSLLTIKHMKRAFSLEKRDTLGDIQLSSDLWGACRWKSDSAPSTCLSECNQGKRGKNLGEAGLGWILKRPLGYLKLCRYEVDLVRRFV